MRPETAKLLEALEEALKARGQLSWEFDPDHREAVIKRRQEATEALETALDNWYAERQA